MTRYNIQTGQLPLGEFGSTAKLKRKQNTEYRSINNIIISTSEKCMVHPIFFLDSKIVMNCAETPGIWRYHP